MSGRHDFPALALAIALGLGASAAALAAQAGDASTRAEVDRQAAQLDRLAGGQESSTVTRRFAADFADFAGSQDNAEALIGGLRTGSPITLSGGPGSTTAVTTITPPTRPMGYGNAYLSLSLARAQLAAYGITQPTPEQLQAALTGGSLTVSTVGADGSVTTRTVTMEGILTQRAAGMGWGEIAKANGFKLGPVVSAMKTASHRLAPPAVKAEVPATQAATTGQRVSGGHAYGRGITTALSGGGVVYGGSRGKHAETVAALDGARQGGVSQGHGGSGVKVSPAGLTTAGGMAPGNSGSAPGHNKAR